MIKVKLTYTDDGWSEVINDGVHAAVGIITDALLKGDVIAISIDPSYEIPEREERDR